MTAIDDLAAVVGTEPWRLRQTLRRSAAEGRGVLVDSGGLRVIWRPSELIIERYEVLEGTTPWDLIQSEL